MAQKFGNPQTPHVLEHLEHVRSAVQTETQRDGTALMRDHEQVIVNALAHVRALDAKIVDLKTQRVFSRTRIESLESDLRSYRRTEGRKF